MFIIGDLNSLLVLVLMMEQDKVLKRFYQELKKVKTELKKEYDEKKLKIDEAEVEKRIAQSQHLIDFESIEVDKKWLERLFREYLLILKKLKDENEELLKKLEKGFKQKEFDLEVLAKRVFCYDSDYITTLAEKLALEVEDLYLLGLQMGKPIFELYAGKLMQKIDLDRWSKGICPVCGSSPAMAYLRKEDGKRILWCQFCGTEWSFLRLKCPFCSNEDQKTLRYFFTEEKDPRRVYVCDECKKYVKTIDQRKMEKPEDLDLAWENLHTFAMDLVAQKEGFLNPYSQPEGKKRGVIT